MSDGKDVRRDESGSIDIAFYRERAERLRRQAILDLVNRIRKRLLASFRPRRVSARQERAGELPNVVRR